jgi:hypothetical protein
MSDRRTVDTITSDELDALYAERDEARQSAAAIAAQRDRLRQRMNTLADRWDNALAPDKAYARTLRAEITCDPFDPEGAMTVQEYTERGRHLWAFRCWGTDTCDGWLGLGHHTQTSALLERERHVAEMHAAPDPAATERETTTRLFAALHRSAEQDVSRVIALYERWVKAGPPPLGTSMSRWWDARLVELHDAIRPPADQPKEK